MINYYEEFNLNPKSSIEEINKELTKQESLWTRRQVTTPEKATDKLSLINQARKVFSSISSKMEYDRTLENSKKQPEQLDPMASRSQKFQKWYAQAKSYLKIQQYDLALSSIEKALLFFDTESDDDQFYHLVSEVYYKNNNYQMALNYINKAIITNPQIPTYYILKARILWGQWNENTYSVEERGRISKNIVDTLSQAITISHDINDSTNESNACFIMASFYYSQLNIIEAERFAQKAVHLDEYNWKANDLLNKIQNEKKQKQEELRRKQADELKKLQIKDAQERKKREQEAREYAEQQKRKQEEAEKAKKKRIDMIRKTYVIWWFVFIVYSAIIAVFSFSKIHEQSSNQSLLFFIAIVFIIIVNFGAGFVAYTNYYSVVPINVICSIISCICFGMAANVLTPFFSSDDILFTFGYAVAYCIILIITNVIAEHLYFKKTR